MRDLPHGWSQASVLELAGKDGIVTDGDWVESKDQDTAGTVRLIQLADIGDGYFINKSQRFMNEETVDRLNCTRLAEGDLLIARMPDPLGRGCIFPDISQPAVTAVDVFVWRPDPKLAGAETRWLMHTINSPTVRLAIQSEAGGTTRQRVAGGKLKQLQLPVPPLLEQRRIVAKVDGLIARTARARKELDRIPTLIAHYKQRLLALAFSGELTSAWREIGNLHDDWSSAKLGDLALVGTGSTPKRGTLAYYAHGTIPWVTSGVVNVDLVSEATQFITEAAIRETNCKVFPAGTLLVAMYGEGQTRGKVAVLGIPAATNQALAAIQLKSERVISQFVFWFFKSNYLRLREQAAGGVQPNLSLGLIKQLDIPLPPMEEQVEIVRRIESAFGWLDRMTADHAAAARLLPKLDAAILAKGFRGELIPQDPSDEPASVLLERIKAERLIDGKKPKPGRGRLKTPKPEEKDETTRWVNDGGAPLDKASRRAKGKQSMTKSRQDDDVMGKAYLAGLLKSAQRSDVQTLFRTADLPVADFYKQLAWEIDKGHILDSADELKAA